MGDPLRPSQQAANTGSAALDRGRNACWELAEVLSYNTGTHTAVVRTHRGRPLRDVPQLRTGPGAFENFDIGTTVVISWDLGFPVIIGCMSFLASGLGIVSPPVVTGISGLGDDNPVLSTQGSNSYKPPYAPTDLTQGDWARVGTMGNHVAVLEGGISSMGSPSAMVRSLGLAGVLQFIMRTSQTYSDFGEWHVENDQGRTSFILRAGANQTTQTGVDEQHWTIRIDLGASGDLFNFVITEPDGRVVFRLHVTSDGRVQLYGDGGVDISSGAGAGGIAEQEIAGGREVHVGNDDTLTVGGSRATRIDRTDETTVATDKTTVVGGAETRFVNGDVTSSVGGVQTDVVAGGTPADATPGRVARTTKLVNGGWLIDIGNPRDGAAVSALAGYKLRTSLGDIDVESGGALSLKAQQIVDVDGLLIKLGGDAHPLPKFDEFERELAQFLTTLLTALQAGTVGSSVSQTLVALPAALPQLQRFVQKVALGLPFQSVKVRNS